MDQQEPTLGRIVHYVNEVGAVLPAIIVAVWSAGCVNLQVFTDGGNSSGMFSPSDTVNAQTNDGCMHLPMYPNVVHRTSVVYDETGGAKRSWHWPPRN